MGRRGARGMSGGLLLMRFRAGVREASSGLWCWVCKAYWAFLGGGRKVGSQKDGVYRVRNAIELTIK